MAVRGRIVAGPGGPADNPSRRNQRQQQVGVEAPAAMDLMPAAVDEMAMPKGWIPRRISTKDHDVELRGDLEPGAGGQYLDLGRYDFFG